MDLNHKSQNMLVIVKQRFPDNSNKNATEFECSSLEDVLKVPFVQRWLNDSTFYRFYKSTSDGDEHLLICETSRGKGYWAIGFLYGDVVELNIPEWKE
jgi:hypothetical protein